ncbi:MAG TPA: MBOAT family O-acyltransferase [Acidimicrobiales bacterium]|nr:MBOAT family O-acyltransferase [Acidimicrobiales bacterium]
MLFPTIRFAIFFSVVLPASWLLMPRHFRWRVFMVAASFVFYASWNTSYVLLLGASIVGNQFFANLVHRAPDDGARRRRVVAALIGNLTVLGWFKYVGFVSSSAGSALRFLHIGWQPPVPNVLLPVGISFFTFQAISYVVDVYRREIEPASFLDFAVYLSFFPHLVAGPIVRAKELVPQLRVRRDPRRVEAGRAFWLIGAGLFKKVVIASYLAGAADSVFDFPHQHGGLSTLVGIYAYALQIYADFSGYTDIAIGLALLLGFRFPLNFDAPYTSSSLQDFWRRWHMTLSRWLRDYVYIGLGGNRDGRTRMYRNIMLTMLLGGLWHGAAWTFVFWGALHGGGLVLERYWRERRTARHHDAMVALASVTSRAGGEADVTVEPPPPSVPLELPESTPRLWMRRVLVFQFVCLGWVFFRAPTIHDAFVVLGRLLFHRGGNVDLGVVLVIVLMLASQFVPRDVVGRMQVAFTRWGLGMQIGTLALVLLLIDVLGPTGIAPFIYFQF